MPNDIHSRGEGNTPPKLFSRRLLLVAGVALLAFLAGAIPMWLQARACHSQLRETRREMLFTQMQALLGSAAIDARRGNYEPARQATSEFFTLLRAESDRGPATPIPAEKLNPLLAQRDALITLLARADPASADRLSDLYVAYRQLVPPSEPNPAQSPRQ